MRDRSTRTRLNSPRRSTSAPSPARTHGIPDMAQSLEDLGALKGDAPVQPEAPVHVQKLDKYGRAYATGKRKDAVARVWVKPGSGRIVVNDKEFISYFARPVLQMILKQPIIAANR